MAPVLDATKMKIGRQLVEPPWLLAPTYLELAKIFQEEKV